jgi:hypothetical protein
VHTTAGYLLGAHLTTKYVFDLHDERHLLVHRRHRLGDRATATSSTARCRTARPA